MKDPLENLELGLNLPGDAHIIWRPNPGPQTWLLQKTEKEIVFGGQRGGGKTDAGIVWMGASTQDFPDYRGLVLRRNHVDLSDWISRAKKMYAQIGGEYVSGEFRFPKYRKNEKTGYYERVAGTGAIIKTGHLAQEDAYERYQGHEYQKILIEELTHIPTLDLFLALLGSNRSTVPGLPAQFLGTTNPGGPGHRWVKQRYVDTASIYKRKYKDYNNIEQEVNHGKRYTQTLQDGRTLTRIFVPSRVEDNPYLFEKDPDYIAYLDSLPEERKKAWREGSWDVYDVKGAYYARELSLMAKQGRRTKVPYDPAALVHTWWDLGNPENTSVGFFQQVGLEWHMIDHHIGGPGGIKSYVTMMHDKRIEYGYEYGSHWAPHDIEAKEFSTGMTRRETAKSLGIRFKIAPKYSIADGHDAVRLMLEKLWIDEEKCDHVLEALANYKQKWNNTLSQYESEAVHDWASHPADMMRYWAVTNMPMQPKQSLLAKKKQQEAKQQDYDKYSLFR